MIEARQQWTALWAEVEEYDAEGVGVQVCVEDSGQVPAVTQLPSIVEIESETESDNALLMDDDVPIDPDLVDAHIDYDEPISQDILSEVYEDTVIVIDQALMAKDLVGLALVPRGDDNQVIKLTRELAEVKEKLRVAVESRAKLQMERDAAVESANVFKTSNHALSVKISEEVQKFETQGRVMVEMQKKLNILGCADSDLDREIVKVTQECYTLEREEGTSSSNYKLWIKHLYRLINIKHQMSPSGPGLASRSPFQL